MLGHRLRHHSIFPGSREASRIQWDLKERGWGADETKVGEVGYTGQERKDGMKRSDVVTAVLLWTEGHKTQEPCLSR